MGDLGHIAGIGHLAIPVHPVMSRLPWTAAPSSRILSLSHAAVNVRLGLGTQ